MSRKILVVIDMQNDFVTGTLGTPEAAALVPELASFARDYAGEVVYTMDTHGADYTKTQEGKHLPVVHCLRGSQGWRLVPELDTLQRATKAPVFEKDTFGSPELAAWLHDQNEREPIACIELCGVCTDICVVSNAQLIKASLPEVPVSVHAHLCAGVTPETHDAALTVMQSCQVIVC